MPPLHPPEFLWIRVRNAEGGAVEAAEVSVWPASPAKLPAVPSGGTQLPSVPAGSGGEGGGSRGGLVGIAFALLVCTAGALVAVRLRWA